jgi:hypothetical protein
LSGFTEQLAALAGVVIGATASYLIGAATDRARWARGQSARWDERRAQAYADYAYAVKALYMQSMLIANSRGLGARREIVDFDAALAEMARLASDRTAKWELVLLLGDPDTIAAARTWHRRTWQLERYARGERADPDGYAVLRADIDADRARFYAAARRDLGIKSGNIPSGGPWELEPPDRPAPLTSKMPENQPD